MLNAQTLLTAARALRRRPGFALLASFTLALGIAAVTAVFALIDAVLLAPLPYPAASELALISMDARPWSAISPQMYQALDGVPGLRSRGAVFAPRDVNLAGGGDPQIASAWPVDAGLLPTLGVNMRLGRNFSADEDRPHGARVAILGHAFWQRQFGGAADVIGKTVQVDGVNTEVIGVLPAEFRLNGAPDLLLPLALPPNSQDMGTNLIAVARLDPNVTQVLVGKEIDARVRAALRDAGVDQTMQGAQFALRPLAASFGAASKPVLLLFLFCAGCVLLLVAANLANLMLLRALARGHESAVRAALGARGAQLAAPALAEGLWVGIAGAVIGLLLAWVALKLGQATLLMDWLDARSTPLGPRSFLVAFGMGIAVALLATVFGIWRGRSPENARELAAGTRMGSSVGTQRLGRSLVVAQAALASLLLGSAALLTHFLWQLTQIEPGFNAEGVIVMRTSPSAEIYPHTASLQAYAERIIERFGREAGVEQVALTTTLPIGSQLNVPVQRADGSVLGGEPPQYRAVAGAAFASFGIPLLAGRDFEPTDRAGGEPVAIVSEAFARRYFDGKALGQSLRNDLGNDTNLPLMRVVGVVGNVRQFGPQDETPPTLYVPLAQVPDDLMSVLRQFTPINIAVRVGGAPMPYFPRLRTAMREVDPTQAVADMRLLERDVEQSTADERMIAILIAIFAGLAIVLAAVGLYSVSAVAVASRRREYGVRLALGSAPSRLLGKVLGSGLRDVGIGLVLGLGCLLLLGRVLDFGFSPWNPLALGVTLLVILMAGLAASLVPALRAARTEPMASLRDA